MCPQGRPRGQGDSRGLHLWYILQLDLLQEDDGQPKKLFVQFANIRFSKIFYYCTEFFSLRAGRGSQ